MAETDGRIDPHLKAKLTGTVAEQEVLAHVTLVGELEVEQGRDRPFEAPFVVAPIRVRSDHGLDDVTLNQHKRCSYARSPNKPHAIHRQLAILVIVEVCDVGFVDIADAGDTRHDALLGVLRPRQQAQDVFRLEVDVAVDEHQVVRVRLQQVLHQHVARPRDHRTAAYAADIDVDTVLRSQLREAGKRDRQLQGHLEVVGGEADEDLFPRHIEAFNCLHMSPVKGCNSYINRQSHVNPIVGKDAFAGNKDRIRHSVIAIGFQQDGRVDIHVTRTRCRRSNREGSGISRKNGVLAVHAATAGEIHPYRITSNETICHRNRHRSGYDTIRTRLRTIVHEKDVPRCRSCVSGEDSPLQTGAGTVYNT